MLKIFIKILTLTSLTVFSFSALSKTAERNLPPILDFYPSCSYKIIENAVESDVTDDSDSKDIVAKLLIRLKTKAENVGADGVILTKKNIIDLSTLKNDAPEITPYKYRISFSAELIKQCKEVKTKNIANANVNERTVAAYHLKDRKVAAYNHLGIKAKGVISYSGRSSTVHFSWSNTPTNNRPEITNNAVSLENGVYGLKLGANYQQVLNAFGEPNVKLTILEGELIVGYGRRHWLHFQQDKLVKIQSTLRFLSAETLNKIPLLDFFDERTWKINNKIGWKSTLGDVHKVLEIDSPLNSKNQLVLSYLGNILTLDFIYSKNHHTNEKVYTLDSFSLKKEDYKVHAVLPFNRQVIQNQAIEQAYFTLKNNEELNLKELEIQLGDPVGSIILAKGATLNIYNPHLLVRLKHAELMKVHFIEEVFIKNKVMKFADVPWTLGRFKQGNSFEQLQKYFPEDSFEDNEEVEIEASNHTLSLFFGEDNQINSLYEAKIELY